MVVVEDKHEYVIVIRADALATHQQTRAFSIGLRGVWWETAERYRGDQLGRAAVRGDRSMDRVIPAERRRCIGRSSALNWTEWGVDTESRRNSEARDGVAGHFDAAPGSFCNGGSGSIKKSGSSGRALTERTVLNWAESLCAIGLRDGAGAAPCACPTFDGASNSFSESNPPSRPHPDTDFGGSATFSGQMSANSASKIFALLGRSPSGYRWLFWDSEYTRIPDPSARASMAAGSTTRPSNAEANESSVSLAALLLHSQSDLPEETVVRDAARFSAMLDSQPDVDREQFLAYMRGILDEVEQLGSSGGSASSTDRKGKGRAK
ncbi:hypothetical protein C8R47DRAFT_1080579 [Mycena vitilis]|nr:hypothetical protein C8R47DRAFT_1080579 [Mycena vitilis]